jgi:hypothetical protein
MNDRMLNIIAKANAINKIAEKKDKTKNLSEREKGDSAIMEQVNLNFEEINLQKEKEKLEERLKDITSTNEAYVIEEKYTVEEIRNSRLPEPIKKAKIEAILERERSNPVKKFIKENKQTSTKAEESYSQPSKTKVDLEELFQTNTLSKKNDISSIIKETVKSTLKEISSDVEDGGTVKIVIKNKILICKVLKVQDIK